MADSDNESDFASAESDQEEADSGVDTKVETTKARPSSETQAEEEGVEVVEKKEEAELAERENGGERTTTALEQKEEPEKRTTDSKSELFEEDSKLPSEGTPPSGESRDKSESGSAKTEPVPVTTAASTAAAAAGTAKKEEEGGGGGWGWGGWGKSLWSSVSTVTESAQALGQKVSSAIASVEDALGLPSPEDLAVDKDTNTEEVMKQADEMVEHDTAPEVEEEEKETVVEEPHTKKESEEVKKEKEKEGVKGETKSEENKNASSATDESQQQSYAGMSSFLSGIASMVQTTGKDFVSGGLDALENLGKKTMEVLTEGDPGLKEKRALISGGKTPTLSELLREAKADTDEQAKGGGASDEQAPLSYSRLFDEYKGVVHLEALDLLSKECESKVRSGYAAFSGERLHSLREKMEELAQAFQIEEEPEVLDDDSSQLHEVLELFSDITLPIKVDRLMKVSDAWREKAAATSVSEAKEEQHKEEDKQSEGGAEEEKEKVNKEDKDGAVAASSEDPNKAKRATCEVLYENGLRSLAELTSASIELFRKMSEISLLPDVQKNQPLEQAQKFNRLTVVVSKELDCLASVHSEAITELDLTDANSCVTSLYLEASNSGSYVQDAFQLLLPVLKYMLLQQWLAEQPSPSANVLTRN